MFKKLIAHIFGERAAPKPIDYNNAEELHALLLEAGMDVYADQVVNAAQNAATLQKPTDSTHVVGSTKIGGKPDLPDAIDWPIRTGDTSAVQPVGVLYKLLTEQFDADNREYYGTPQPLHFLAQINLSEMPVGVINEMGLPTKGMLYFFYDVLGQGWGFDPRDAPFSKVLYTEDLDGIGPREMPKIDHVDVHIHEVPLVSRTTLQAIPPEAIHFNALNLSEDARDKYYDFFEDEANHLDFTKTNRGWPDRPAHQLGGWAEPIQGAMEEECALVSSGLYAGRPDAYESDEGRAILAQPNDWKLLFQLDSDDDADIMWGDAGRLYYWIRAEDLKQRNFDNVWVILQCG